MDSPVDRERKISQDIGLPQLPLSLNASLTRRCPQGCFFCVEVEMFGAGKTPLVEKAREETGSLDSLVSSRCVVSRGRAETGNASR